MSLRDKLKQRRAAKDARRACVDEQAERVREQARAHATAMHPAPSTQTPGTFSHLYSSRDDVLSVFEDASGHVVAVDSRRLA